MEQHVTCMQIRSQVKYPCTPPDQVALQSEVTTCSNCSRTIGIPQTSLTSIHTQDGRTVEEGLPSSRDHPFSEQTCSDQQGIGDQLIRRTDETSKWWVSSATQAAKNLDHARWESRGALDGEIRQNLDQSLDQKLDEWRCKWQLLTCSPLRFPDKGFAPKGSGMSPSVSPTPVSNGHDSSCNRHDVQPENEGHAMVRGKRADEEVKLYAGLCATEREQEVPKKLNDDAAPKTFQDPAELAESLIYKMLGVLSEQQKHLQLCELDNLRLIEAGHQHQTRILEDTRKQELLEQLSLMQETHQLLILCAGHLSRGRTAPSCNGITPSVSSLSKCVGKKDLDGQEAAALKGMEEKRRQELKFWQNVAEERGRALQESLQVRHRRAQREQEQQRYMQQLQERCQMLQHQLVTAQAETQRCLQLLEKYHVRLDTSVTREEEWGVFCGELQSEKMILKQVQSQLINAREDARMWQELADIRGETLDLSLLGSCANSNSPGSSKKIDRGGVKGDAEWQSRVISLQERAREERASPQYISVNPPLQLSSRTATKMQLFSPALSGTCKPAEKNHVVEL